MTKPLEHIVTIILAFIILGLIYLNHKQNNQNKDAYVKQIQDLQLNLKESGEQRDSLVHVVNSIDSVSKVLSIKIQDKNRELREIRSRYKDIPVSQLGRIMDERALRNKME